MTIHLKQEFDGARDADEPDRGNPTGTSFAAITMIVLLAAVLIYLALAYGHELVQSPVLGPLGRPDNPIFVNP